MNSPETNKYRRSAPRPNGRPDRSEPNNLPESGFRVPPAPNRARVGMSAAPGVVLHPALFVDSAYWCQSWSQNTERWQRNRKTARIGVNQIEDELSLLEASFNPRTDHFSSLNATVASGGKCIRIDCSRPIQGTAWVGIPPKFPTLLPPYVSASVLISSR
jgi:hypothetical protein